MVFARRFAILGIAASLAACAVPPPSAPSVLALPGKGKDLTVFQQDDAACRQYAASLLAAPTGAPSAAHPAGYGQPYDVSYTQCMVSRGDTVPPQPQPTYASAYPGYYDDVYGPGFGAFDWGPGLFIGGWHDHDGRRDYRRGDRGGGIWHRNGGGGPHGNERP